MRTQKGFALPTTQLEAVNSDRFFMDHVFKDIQHTRIGLPDKCDSNFIAEAIVKHKIVHIRARYPGSGKTYSRQQIQNVGRDTLLDCPTTVGAQK